MASKFNLRRRALKASHVRGANPYASPRPSPAKGRKVQAQAAGAIGHRASRRVTVAICCLLALGEAGVFVQTVRHGFVNLDDNQYVYENLHVQRGLNFASAWWAVTQAHSANWHPLTWLSHTLDWQVFGRWDAARKRYVDSWPGGHHLVNVVLHGAAAVLLFLVLQEMTAATWPSALAAALFAIHPLRAESVAWVAERKDVLSGLLFMLTLAAYRAYSIRPFSYWRYGLVIAGFALGLTAKPMLVTLPFVLLLLDYWPLGRVGGGWWGANGKQQNQSPPTIHGPPSMVEHPPSTSLLRLLLEKVPLLALSAGSCALTLWAQGLVAAFKPLDFRYRLGNALVSYAAYIGQMFYPTGMIVQYAHPGAKLLLEDTLLPIAVLTVITLAVLWLGGRRRYLAVGWFWYLGTLLPVIGLVQVGVQARSDRYTYLTQIGLYLMIAWGLSDLFRAWRARAAWYAAAAATILAALAAVAWLQTSYWQNSLALWGHCVSCQPDTNDFAQNSYGEALNAAGRMDEADAHFIKSIQINSKYISPWIQIAVHRRSQGKPAEALKICDEALKFDPDNAQAHALKAVALYDLNQPERALDEFRIAIGDDPNNSESRANLAEVLRSRGRYGEALAQCRAALQLNPEMAQAHRTLADVLWHEGQFAEAVAHRKLQLAFQPRDAAAAIGVARGLISDPRPEARFGAEALAIARRACEATNYQDIVALEVLAAACAETGDFDQAQSLIRKALETPMGKRPDNAVDLQKRLFLYHDHRKAQLPPPRP